MNVPFLDIKGQNRELWPKLHEAVTTVMAQAEFILGPAVERFESDFAAYNSAAYCVGLNNGTSALHMALRACDIGAGDEVITTPHTWISTCWAISYVGATPVFVDIDPVTYTLDPGRVERAISARTRAILPVHLYGQAADVERLARIAHDRNLLLIEDCAQAHGATVSSRKVGTFGRIGCYSFYPGKNLGAFGESGAVVTNDVDVANRIRRLRDHAQEGRHHHVELGYNTRMEGVQAAALSVKLPYLDGWNAARRAHARHYAELLADASGLVLPVAREADAHVWHLYSILLTERNRDRVREQLAARGVSTGVHYPVPVHLQPAYAHLGKRPGEFPVAEKVMQSCISLPLFPELTRQQVEYVASEIREVMSV